MFLDEEHNETEEAKAKWLVIHTYDNKGDLSKEVWVDLKQKEK